MIYLDGSGDVSGEDFQYCADIVFDLIGNMEMITFLKTGTGDVLASYDRNGAISISTVGGAARGDS